MNHFKHITIISREHRPSLTNTLEHLIAFLQAKQINIALGEVSAQLHNSDDLPTIAEADIGKNTDLVIVIGGDGSLLRAAKAAAPYNTPVLGINRGTLGFLTDIPPEQVEDKLTEVLNGQFIEESRYLLAMTIHSEGNTVAAGSALNEVVLLPGKDSARMIEFNVHINHDLVCHQRADGLIISTPTGSTAYSLSAGGPIIKPDLEANVIVPMSPHTLSMRPIVVSADNRIKVTIANELDSAPRVACDGNEPVSIPLGGHLHIDKSPHALRLLHPADYDYFQTLRSKLRWGEKLC